MMASSRLTLTATIYFLSTASWQNIEDISEGEFGRSEYQNSWYSGTCLLTHYCMPALSRVASKRMPALSRVASKCMARVILRFSVSFQYVFSTQIAWNLLGIPPVISRTKWSWWLPLHTRVFFRKIKPKNIDQTARNREPKYQSELFT